jgi:hypothetical protein
MNFKTIILIIVIYPYNLYKKVVIYISNIIKKYKYIHNNKIIKGSTLRY